jgi:nucleotide-binding universal stress UspA family protein
MMINKILYPTDFSEDSKAALPYAVSLTRQNNAELYCVHVVEMPQEEYLSGEYMLPLNASHVSKDEFLRIARVRLDKFIVENLSEITTVISKVITGTPFVEIIRYARDQSIDLIVMGTHGHSALAAMLLGSVAEKVVRKAPCPVLTVRDPKHVFEMP